MVRSAVEAYEKGYADGLFMAEKMRWAGTPLGTLMKGSSYRPERNHRAAYEEGFKHALEDASRIECEPSKDSGS